MQQRTNWELSTAHFRWNSVRVHLDGVVPQNNWHSIASDGTIFLKDTRSACYNNILLDGGHQFSYELPKKPRECDKPILNILSNACSQAEGAARVTVRLFAAENARNHYLGEFVPVRYNNTLGRVTLQRLAEQDEQLRQMYSYCPSKKRRSNSESRHEKIIQEVFKGFVISHEPEAAVNLNGSLVKDGVWSSWAADTYTVDFICCLGPLRVCIESKNSVEEFDERSLERCVALRDSSMTRVVTVAGHGKSMKWIDLGDPHNSTIRYYDDGHAFLSAFKREVLDLLE